MIRATRSLYLRKDVCFYQNVSHSLSPKQILSGLFIKRCHNTASFETELKENNSTDTDQFGVKETNNSLVRSAFTKMSHPDMSHEEMLHAGRINALEGDNSTVNLLKNLLLEEEAMGISQKVTSQQTFLLLQHLAATNNRPLKLLKILCDRVVDLNWEFGLKECSNIMFCLASLGCKHKPVLDHLANLILDQKFKFNSGILPASIIHSAGVLKYRNCEFIEEMLKVVMQFEKRNKISGLVKCVTTLAMINFSSPFGQMIIKELRKHSPADFSQTVSYLNFVWASVVLNDLCEEHISHVLSENFVNTILVAYENDSPRHLLKILNIQGSVSILNPSYSGPKVDEKLFLMHNIRALQQSSKLKAQFLTSVVDGLGHIFPKIGFLKTMVDIGGGFSLDVECCLDPEGNPVLLKKRNDYDKVGILLLGFQDTCLDSENTMTGPCALKKRLVEIKGYKTLTIPYWEYNKLLKLSDKVEYLGNKLKSLCSREIN